jgi:hypothetical protein
MGGWGVSDGISEIDVARGVYMHLKFVEEGETRYKVVEFRRVGIANKEFIDNKGEGGGVGVVAEEHGGGGFGVPVLGEEGDKSKLR